ncbi:hypothetical protein QFZ79_003643 [Arthrobacter sp. V4I6]|nr:hypothetical protein [Arthrobacter sp. V4I6]
MDLGHGGAASLVPVTVGLRDELAGVIDQAVVHGPGVDADARDPRTACRGRPCGRGESVEHFREQGLEVPAQAAAGLHHTIWEAAHRLQ